MELFDLINDASFGHSGEGSQINIYDEVLGKYKLWIPTESVPSVIGSTETIEHRPTTSRVVGQIDGQTTLDSKDVPYLWCRQNNDILDKNLGKVCKFLNTYPDGTGWKYEAKYTYRPDDSDTSNKVSGTITLIPTDSDMTYTPDVSDIFVKTCLATNMTTSKIELSGTNKTRDITLELSNASGTITTTSSNSAITANVSGKKVTITVTGDTKTSGIVYITTSATGEASWTYPIFVTYTV